MSQYPFPLTSFSAVFMVPKIVDGVTRRKIYGIKTFLTESLKGESSQSFLSAQNSKLINLT